MLRTRIWNELTKSKHDIEFLRVYLILQSTLSRWINILILVFSSSGILGWGIWNDPKLAGVACTLTAVMALIKMISPYFILSEEETKKLDKYYTELVNLYDNLEKFWYKIEEEDIDHKQMSDEFYKLVNTGNGIHERYGDLSVIHLNRLTDKADKHTNDYFNTIFNIEQS